MFKVNLPQDVINAYQRKENIHTVTAVAPDNMIKEISSAVGAHIRGSKIICKHYFQCIDATGPQI
jgi:hypothetical protein